MADYCYKHEAGWTDGLCWVIFNNDQKSIARVSDEPTADQIVSALNGQQPCKTCGDAKEICDGCGRPADTIRVHQGDHWVSGPEPNLDEPCGPIINCPDCQPCYGLSCPHWAQCFPQFKEDVTQLEEDKEQAAARIEGLEKTNQRLNRRCQAAEKGVSENIDACKRKGVSLGRALAAAGYYKLEAAIENAIELLDDEPAKELLRAALGEEGEGDN